MASVIIESFISVLKSLSTHEGMALLFSTYSITHEKTSNAFLLMPTMKLLAV